MAAGSARWGSGQEARDERPPAAAGTGYSTQTPHWRARKNYVLSAASLSPSSLSLLFSAPRFPSLVSLSLLSRSRISPPPRLSPRFLYLPFSLFSFRFLVLGILSAPGRSLFPFPSVFLFHFVSRSFFNPFCSFSFFLTFVASLLLSLHWLCSPWANECPSAAVCGHPERARGTQLAPRTTGCTPGISGALRVRGAPRGSKGRWNAAPDPMWGSVLRNLS